MRSQESNYMYSSFTKSTIKNQNTQLTEKSVGITIRMFPDYPIEKSQYPINKKISGYYPIHQNFLSGALHGIVIFSEEQVDKQTKQIVNQCNNNRAICVCLIFLSFELATSPSCNFQIEDAQLGCY